MKAKDKTIISTDETKCIRRTAKHIWIYPKQLKHIRGIKNRIHKDKTSKYRTIRFNISTERRGIDFQNY
jgi:hypothetical protein